MNLGEPWVNPLFPMFEGANLLFMMLVRLAKTTGSQSAALLDDALKQAERTRDEWKDFMSLPGAYP